MPTYVNTKDALNVSVSCFKNYDTPANPVTINLFTWLTNQKYRANVEALRLEADKGKRDALKATLPAITPSAVFTYRKESAMVAGSHTRLVQFDIDPQDNPHIRNYADLKAQISKLPFVAYCALSASGKGYWGLVVIAYPERHGQHFDALRRVFAHYGINMDTKPRNVASLRGYSYDPAPYQPERVMVFELYDEPATAKARPFAPSSDADTDRKRVEVCIQEVIRQGRYLGHSYGEWYEVGCSLANGFGESGRDYFHQVSQHYPGYQLAQTDRQFTACLKAHSKATLGTFFHLCQQARIEWKELMPLSDPYPPQPPFVTVKQTAQQTARAGSLLKPDESQLDRLEVEPCETYPAEWDEPNEPDAIPQLKARSFFDWQRQYPPFNQLGIHAITNS